MLSGPISQPRSTSNQELTKAMTVEKTIGAFLYKELQKKTTNKKTTDVVSKNCICAPTSHAGSFRCRLHRTDGAKGGKTFSSNGEKGGKRNSALHKPKIGSINGQTGLSRFAMTSNVVSHEDQQ